MSKTIPFDFHTRLCPLNTVRDRKGKHFSTGTFSAVGEEGFLKLKNSGRYKQEEESEKNGRNFT